MYKIRDFFYLNKVLAAPCLTGCLLAWKSLKTEKMPGIFFVGWKTGKMAGIFWKSVKCLEFLIFHVNYSNHY